MRESASIRNDYLFTDEMTPVLLQLALTPCWHGPSLRPPQNLKFHSRREYFSVTSALICSMGTAVKGSAACQALRKASMMAARSVLRLHRKASCERFWRYGG